MISEENRQLQTTIEEIFDIFSVFFTQTKGAKNYTTGVKKDINLLLKHCCSFLCCSFLPQHAFFYYPICLKSCKKLPKMEIIDFDNKKKYGSNILSKNR